jgi:hypothetical protein
MMCHYANISYRIGKSFQVNPTDGHILDKEGIQILESNSSKEFKYSIEIL